MEIAADEAVHRTRDADGSVEVQMSWSDALKPTSLRVTALMPYVKELWHAGGKDLVQFHFPKGRLQTDKVVLDVDVAENRHGDDIEMTAYRVSCLLTYILCGPVFRCFRRVKYYSNPLEMLVGLNWLTNRSICVRRRNAGSVRPTVMWF